MVQKKNSNLRLMQREESEGTKKNKERHQRIRPKKVFAVMFLAGMVIFGTYLLLANHFYHAIYQAASYKRETSDNNRYAVYQNGIVRYSRDGVAYLNQKNEVIWVQPGQFQRPVIEVNNQTFAVADSGGNAIQVFTEKGLKGEIETNLPIEKFSISNQGIVSAILKDENLPMIVTYDSKGNILVENQITASNAGYPVALEMSPDGTVLAVSYLDTKSDALKSRVVYYNFAEAGEEKENHQVSMEEYEDSVMPEIFFMDADTSVVVGDHSFVIYEGAEVPKKKKEIAITQEVKSVFHTGRYIGFVLLREDKSGYELRLFDRFGKQKMNRQFIGEYSNVQMVGNEIVMYEGSRCSIYTSAGLHRFEGNLKEEVLLIVPVAGINKYLVMNAAELQVVYLAG